jgi:DNA-binding CsgD family transcriptional regulator
VLEPLGVDRESEELYLRLAPLGAATADDLAEQIGSASAVVAEQLVRLGDLGLAVRTGTGVWQTVPLPNAVKVLQSQRRSELEAAVTMAETLHSHILAARQSKSDDVTTIVGRDAINSAHAEVCESAQHEIIAFDKPPYVTEWAATKDWLQKNSPEWQALERGVGVRAVYQPGFDSQRLKEFRLFGSIGERARVGYVPMKLILVDNRVALIPSMKSYAPGHELQATIVRHSMLVEAISWLFEAAWDRSVSLTAIDLGSGVDPKRDQLVSLLMAGSSDIEIAKEFGVNERTVRRWVAELMEELEVGTRLQLGAALTRSDDLRHDERGLSAS